MVQEVFVLLFQVDGKVLCVWDFVCGMLFESFVGLLVQYQVILLLCSGCISVWCEELMELECMDVFLVGMCFFEVIVVLCEILCKLFDCVGESLLLCGFELFQWFIIDEEFIDIFGQQVGMICDVFY